MMMNHFHAVLIASSVNLDLDQFGRNATDNTVGRNRFIDYGTSRLLQSHER
jgi:hypothetical protein